MPLANRGRIHHNEYKLHILKSRSDCCTVDASAEAHNHSCLMDVTITLGGIVLIVLTFLVEIFVKVEFYIAMYS